MHKITRGHSNVSGKTARATVSPGLASEYILKEEKDGSMSVKVAENPVMFADPIPDIDLLIGIPFAVPIKKTTGILGTIEYRGTPMPACLIEGESSPVPEPAQIENLIGMERRRNKFERDKAQATRFQAHLERIRANEHRWNDLPTEDEMEEVMQDTEAVYGAMRAMTVGMWDD